jgi:hypothetical protein
MKDYGGQAEWYWQADGRNRRKVSAAASLSPPTAHELA